MQLVGNLAQQKVLFLGQIALVYYPGVLFRYAEYSALVPYGAVSHPYFLAEKTIRYD
jgi:hypothetical protein